MKYYMLCGLVTLLSGSVRGESPPLQLNMDEVQAVIYQDVVIPVPQEIFSSLDKLGSRDWHQQLKKGSTKVPGGRAEQALLFGLVIANGFVAVQVEDAEEVKNVGRDVLKLATALGVKQSVVSHSQSIIDLAGRGEWEGVRRELDRTQRTVEEAMSNMRDDDIAELVSVGGWLGGTNALAGALHEKYDAVGSELLNQPDLLERIASRYFKIPGTLRKGAAAFETGKVLQALTPLMVASNGHSISKERVENIHSLTMSLITTIYGE
jgi:hypothetical protein